MGRLTVLTIETSSSNRNATRPNEPMTPTSFTPCKSPVCFSGEASKEAVGSGAAGSTDGWSDVAMVSVGDCR